MLSFRNQLLQTFGIEHNFTAIMNDDIQLQQGNDVDPFAEIMTDTKGKTTLRVGRLQKDKVPVIKVR